ncbi:hypothetical protein [Microbacterium hydrocarbonoxydans]|uniref:hypothetical protein n=1 Tax=Microbacterium hydrocarbonoxydans TaxID=273678 RepID=UPI0013D9E147|nr:hypothetical protein [Microbacterium hydrocarbonoxydans]
MVLKRARASWWVLLLLAVLCVFPVATAGLSQAADAGADVVDSCWESELPEGVQPRDGTLRSAAVTAIPSGLHCDWEAGDTQTGWPVTVAALIASGACVVLTPFALR